MRKGYKKVLAYALTGLMCLPIVACANNGMTDEQEKIIERITETMMKRYEKQINAYFTGLKENKKNQFGGIYE